MSNLVIGLLSFPVLLGLIFVRVPIGLAMFVTGFGGYWNTGGACFLSENPVSACRSATGYTLKWRENRAYSVSNNWMASDVISAISPANTQRDWTPSDLSYPFYMMWMELSPSYNCQVPGSSTGWRSAPL